jgi:hypothetical protein
MASIGGAGGFACHLVFQQPPQPVAHAPSKIPRHPRLVGRPILAAAAFRGGSSGCVFISIVAQPLGRETLVRDVGQVGNLRTDCGRPLGTVHPGAARTRRDIPLHRTPSPSEAPRA